MSGADAALLAAISASLAASLVFAWRRCRDVAGIELLLGDTLGVRTRGAIDACPVADSRSVGWAVWLDWTEPDGRRRHAMLLPDSLQERRHWPLLRVWAAHRLLPPG